MIKTKLVKLLADTELRVTDQQVEKLVRYVELLDKWNKAYNLTSVRQPEQMVVKHILDSVVVSPYLRSVTDINQNFIDVGTGPGLPGIPLAIINPDLDFTLLDSLGKRIRFITQVKHELKLDNVTPIQSRVEDHNNLYAGVISRAFASISDMVNWSHHLLAEGGRFFALKGQIDQQELNELPDLVTVENIHPLTVPELDGERHLVLLKQK